MAKKEWKTVSIRVTTDQKQELQQRATNSGMNNVNEYIKARLFIDEQEEIYKVTNLDKWIVKAVSNILINTEELSRKLLSDEEIKSHPEQIANLIKRSGFLKEHEIFRNNQG